MLVKYDVRVDGLPLLALSGRYVVYIYLKVCASKMYYLTPQEFHRWLSVILMCVDVESLVFC